MHKPLLIAHRGDTVHFPENTLEAFQSAFDLGADGIECDVQLDEKGELIVVHHYIYDKTKEYPRLSEVLERFSTKGRLEIEIKSFDVVCIEKLASLLSQHNPPDVEITSSILPLLSIIRECIPSAKIGMIFKNKLLEEWMTQEVILQFLVGYMTLTKSNILHLDLDKYTSEIASALHERGYVLHTHLKTDDIDPYNRAKELSIDQCTFDNIDLLKIV